MNKQITITVAKVFKSVQRCNISVKKCTCLHQETIQSYRHKHYTSDNKILQHITIEYRWSGSKKKILQTNAYYKSPTLFQWEI
jgi:hypothetical protein